LEPDEFNGGDGKGAIFRFSTGASNGAMFARGPRNKVGAKEGAKTTSGFSIGAAGPISVRVSLKGAGGRSANEESIGDGEFEVAEDTFYGLKVERGGSVNKLRNFVDSKRDVGESEGEILEGTNKTSV
jgi:hypothetical protein